MDVKFTDLKKSYDGRLVLDLPDGGIRSGSRTALIGPNGAGKSTLLRILAGLESPDQGTVRYHGKTEIPRQDITLVFQKPYLLSTTVENNIAYPMKLRGMSKAKMIERVDELLEELGMTAFKKQKAWKLSGGETQKVALARALSFHPRLLLLDEPTANIDPYTTAEIERILLAISKKESITIVIITHNLAQAKRLCDEALMLHKGALVEAGDNQQVLTRPRNEITRQFVAGELIL